MDGEGGWSDWDEREGEGVRRLCRYLWSHVYIVLPCLCMYVGMYVGYGSSYYDRIFFFFLACLLINDFSEEGGRGIGS